VNDIDFILSEKENGLSNELDVREIERQLCVNSLKYLCSKILKMVDWDKCHDELEERLKRSSGNKKLILMPRGHLKTSIITVAKSIQILCNNPNAKILLANAIWDNARGFLSEIKEYLTDKSKLSQLFGRFESYRWNQDEIVIHQRTRPNKTPSISTAGVEKALASQHYDYIFLDDIVNRQTISNDDQLEKSWKFYTDSLDLLEPNGELYIIGTRWHYADVYGEILERERGNWDVIQMGATDNGEMSGNVIFPKKFSAEKLQKLLDAKGTYEFYSQYFNVCQRKDSQHFKPPARYWSNLDECEYYITFDPATSEKKAACDAVVMVGAINKANQLLAVEYTVFQKKDPAAMIDRIFKYHSIHRARRVGIEVNGGQEIYIKLIKEEMSKRNQFLSLTEIRQNQDKFSRIIALQPRWESGNLLLKQGMTDLEHQLDQFPVGKKVDILDALSMVNQICSPIERAGSGKVYIPVEYRKPAYVLR